MRIFNLSNKSGSLTSSDKFVLDNGTNVMKIDYNALAKAIIEQYTGSTLAGSAQSVKAALDALNSNLNGVKIVLLQKTVSLPAGTLASPSETTIEFSDAPSRFQGVIAYLNSFHLPYIGMNGAMTWVSNVQGKTVTIKNSASAWSDYGLFIVGFCK